MWAPLAAALVLAPHANVAAPVDETTSEVLDPTHVVDLSGVWFHQTGDAPIFARASFDDRAWTPLRVPTARLAWDRRWKGFAWYRRHLYVDARVLGNDLMLSLGPVREVAEVYVNGVLLAQRGHFGSRLRGDSQVMPLVAHIPSAVLHAGENVIAVRLYDPSYTCGLPAGPLLIGPPDVIAQRVWLSGNGALGVRLSLAFVAICIALSQLFVQAGSSNPRREARWAAGAGICLGVMQLQGTGFLAGTLPNLELAVRLPLACTPLAMLCLANFFAAHYDDFDNLRAKFGRAVLAAVAVALLLAPDRIVYLCAQPAIMLCALSCALYIAGMLSQAARRREPGTLPVFGGVLALVGLLVYDGLVPSMSDMFPQWSAMGAVGLLAMAQIIHARVSHAEHEATLYHVVRLEEQLDSRVWMDILAAAASAIDRPQAFLDAVAQEVARQMNARRCSIVLANSQGALYVAACQGLPTQARLKPIHPGRSIARYVFDSGLSLTPANLPQELLRPDSQPRANNYDTSGFIAQPVRNGSSTLGVLNVSDRNNGAFFSPEDEAMMGIFGARLGLVLQRLNVRLDDLLDSVGTVVHRDVIRPEVEAKGKVITPEMAAAKAVSKNLS